MTYESALRYTEESVKQCKELANFLKKRQQAEHDYARTLVKLSQKPPGMANLSPSFYRSPAGSTTNLNSTNPSEKPELSKAHLMKSSLWKGYGEIVDETSKLAEAHEMAMSMQQDVIDPFTNYIREMEVVRKAQIEKGQEFLKNLHDAYSGLKKVKKEYEALQASSAEAINNHVRAQQNPATKDREMEKLTIKMQGAVEKAKKAEDTMKWWDEMFATAKEDYFGTFLPGLYEDIRVKEEERCIAVKRALRDFVHLQKAHSSNYNRVMEFLSERVSGIDISEDSEDFVSTHMVDEQRGAIHDVPARNHVSPIIKGRLHLKRGDLVSGWKPKLFILTNDKLLYCYDSDESQRPRDIIGLRAASVSSVDDSFFNKPFCLQVINVTASGRQVYNLSADSESTRDEWLMNLKDHAYCCSKCASGYGYNPDIGSNMHLLDRVNGFRLIRSLELGIMEAKDLPGTLVSGGARGLSPFGVIMFDEVKQARTSTKSGDTPFWGENFFFDDIRPHHNRVRILMFHQNRIQRDTDIGYISIHLDQVKTSKRVEEWFKIKPIPKAGMDENMSGGSIRIAFTFKEDTLLPSVEYDNFLVLVTDPSLHALKFLGRVVTAQREALAKSALRVFTCVSREIEVVSALVEADIAATDDPNILFRGNTLGTKILDQYMKQVGMEYLHATIGGHVRGIMKGKESCELDPLRVEQGVVDADRRNAKRLVSYVSGIWEAIVKSIEHCPSELLVIFSHIRTIVVQKWGPASDTSKYTGISGFIFLRFFCPAILSPKLFNITTEMPNSTSARTLTLIAKILQNLANLTEFGLKEPYMVQCNVFIQEQILNMKAFIDRISTPAEHPNAILTPKPRLDIRRETETLYQIFADHLNEMSNANSTREADSIISVTRELSNLHKSYDAEDGSAASSAVSTDPRGYPGAVPLKPGVVPPRSNQTPGFSATYMMGNQSNSDFPGLALPPKIELGSVRDTGAQASSGSLALMSGSSSPPLNNQGGSPVISPTAYKRHRDMSIYDINQTLDKNSSLESLENMINSIAGGDRQQGSEESLRLSTNEQASPSHTHIPPISTRSEYNLYNTSAPSSPRSGPTSPRTTSAATTWNSDGDMILSADRHTNLTPPQVPAATLSTSPSAGLRGRLPPRASSAGPDRTRGPEIPVPSQSSSFPLGFATTTTGVPAVPNPRNASLFRSLVSTPSVISSPAGTGFHESTPQHGAGSYGDLYGEHSNEVSPTGGHGADDDGMSDRSSVRSMESFKSDGSKSTTGTGAAGVAGAGIAGGRRPSANGVARIKHRFSLLVQSATGGAGSGGGSGGAGEGSTSRAIRRQLGSSPKFDG